MCWTQVAATTNRDIDGQIPNYPSLPPQLICQLHNVTMHVSSLNIYSCASKAVYLVSVFWFGFPISSMGNSNSNYQSFSSKSEVTWLLAHFKWNLMKISTKLIYICFHKYLMIMVIQQPCRSLLSILIWLYLHTKNKGESIRPLGNCYYLVVF